MGGGRSTSDVRQENIRVVTQEEERESEDNNNGSVNITNKLKGLMPKRSNVRVDGSGFCVTTD